MLYELEGKRPQLDESVFVADSAHVIGQVVAERDASIWFNVVIRADNDLIHIGSGSNIQDASVLHTDEGLQVRIGRGVTVGHKVMLHGCSIGDYSLIGIGAVVLNRARIGKHCLIGAGALITEGKEIPDGSVVMGAPGKVVREVSAAQRMMLEGSAAHYIRNAARFKTSCKPL
ncbi:MAG: gamma carbonic anhydrase family protein [Myxococcales bacterium]|nr:gamma carbonic anhydrase family protein [Myxococcales bacterium]